MALRFVTYGLHMQLLFLPLPVDHTINRIYHELNGFRPYVNFVFVIFRVIVVIIFRLNDSTIDS